MAGALPAQLRRELGGGLAEEAGLPQLLLACLDLQARLLGAGPPAAARAEAARALGRQLASPTWWAALGRGGEGRRAEDRG